MEEVQRQALGAALSDLTALVDDREMDLDTAQMTALLTSVATVVVALAGLVRAIRSEPPDPKERPAF